jgi:asparagine synthase (glutamine-hydrolysing)
MPGADAVFGRFAGVLDRWGMHVHPKMLTLFKQGNSYASAFLLFRGLFMPQELDLFMDPAIVAEGLDRLQPLAHIAGALTPEPRRKYAKVAVLESALYMRNQLLRDTDWASMAHSLEVRVPLVDVCLLRELAPSLTRRAVGKRDLANAPSLPLPDAIMQRPKTGFNTPVQTWIERNPGLQHWKDFSPLPAPRYPWARRWSHEVATQVASLDSERAPPLKPIPATATLH